MFGLGRSTPRYSRGATGGSSKLRGALLAGAGLLAYRWWQNRKHHTTTDGSGVGDRSTDWSARSQTDQPHRSDFAAGGTTPGASGF